MSITVLDIPILFALAQTGSASFGACDTPAAKGSRQPQILEGRGNFFLSKMELLSLFVTCDHPHNQCLPRERTANHEMHSDSMAVADAIGPEIAPLMTPVVVDDSVHDLLKHAGILNFVNRFLS